MRFKVGKNIQTPFLELSVKKKKRTRLDQLPLNPPKTCSNPHTDSVRSVFFSKFVQNHHVVHVFHKILQKTRDI